MRRVLLAVACLAIVAAPSPFDPHSAKLKDGDPIQIETSAIPIPQDYNGLGALRPVAALQLTSKDVRFGGWSALEVKANGDFRLLSDRAFALHGRFDQDSDGAIEGIEDARIGVLRDHGGEAALRKRGDSEGLARLNNGRHVVSFELEPRLQFYEFDLLGESALPTDAPILAQVDKLSTNAEFEALTVLPNGSILAGSERGFGGGDDAVLWRVPPDAAAGDVPIEPLTTLKLPDNFSLTELAAAPDGSIYTLFRSYLPILGARAQIWRYRLVEENGQTRAKGEKIAALQTPFPVDNYEGMAIVPAPDGGQRLYVISDDNYRVEQKTILLIFDLKLPARSTP